ncbi:hypothetical protein V6N13_112217 [Hibiscus sabdariffa]|uniref:Uncharacterized protein n=1 Tax=Hibiscus sabdariffa TaxID=183260 RepID=A0ABR2TN43_9ROSI
MYPTQLTSSLMRLLKPGGSNSGSGPQQWAQSLLLVLPCKKILQKTEIESPKNPGRNFGRKASTSNSVVEIEIDYGVRLPQGNTE